MSQAASAQALRPRHSALGLPGCAPGHVITNVTRIHENKKSVSWPLARSEGHPPPDQCVGNTCWRTAPLLRALRGLYGHEGVLEYLLFMTLWLLTPLLALFLDCY
jgi:hypothetical protein